MSTRRFLIVAASAALGLAFAGSAAANYFWPGRVIIGTGIYGGIIPIGGNASDMEMMGNGCIVAPAVECECFQGLTVLEACMQSQVDISCMTPDMVFQELTQPEPVLIADDTKTLDGLRCSGLSEATAIVNLPVPKAPKLPPPQP